MISILITGASSDIGISFLKTLDKKKYKLGLHYFSNQRGLLKIKNSNSNIKLFKKNLKSEKECSELFKDFMKWSNGIDILINLHGVISKKRDWKNLTKKNFLTDFEYNFFSSFIISKLAFEKMKKKGGKIIFTSTSSASHGGGKNSFSYGCSKILVENLTKFLAREGAKYQILSNAIAPGFIKTKFQLKTKTKSEIKSRINLIKLKKSGFPHDVSAVLQMMISENNTFMTGEIIKIDGGDWI